MSARAVSEEVAPGVRRLGSRWVNWYLLEDADGLVVVDSGLPAHREGLVAALDALGRSPRDVSHAVLTHWHPDHTGCAAWLAAELGATVWAPRGEADVITGAEKPRPPNFLSYVWRPTLLRYLANGVRNGVLRVEPVRGVEPYDETTPLPAGLRALPTPGHTPDHHSLLDERRGTLFCGDAMATIDLLTWKPGPRPLPRGVNHDSASVLASLERLEAVDAAVVLAGHGEPWRDGARHAAHAARAAAHR